MVATNPPPETVTTITTLAPLTRKVMACSNIVVPITPPELPFVAGVFTLTLVHVQYHLPPSSFALALSAVITGFIHMFILLRVPIPRFSRLLSASLFSLMVVLLVCSHLTSTPLPPPSPPTLITSSTTSRSTEQAPPVQRQIHLHYSPQEDLQTSRPSQLRPSSSLSSRDSLTESGMTIILDKQQEKELLKKRPVVPHAAARVAARRVTNSPVDAALVVDSAVSAMSMPNSGDGDTEDLENALDETRGYNTYGTLLNQNASSDISSVMRNATFIVSSMTAESCSAACARYHYVCSPTGFDVVNSCRVAQLRLACRTCISVRAPHKMMYALPAAIRVSGHGDEGYGDEDNGSSASGHQCMMLKTKPLVVHHFQCHVSMANVKRLCPCIS